MLVFISWSGERSKCVAKGLQSWLSLVIQAVEPWISTDIGKGARWGHEIAARLEVSKVGIICLTGDNLDEKWIHFEAGALSKTKDAIVCNLLIGVDNSDVQQPLAQFQSTKAEKDDIRKLAHTINDALKKCGEKGPTESTLDTAFDMAWEKMENVIKEALSIKETNVQTKRSDSDILQEILEIVRLHAGSIEEIKRNLSLRENEARESELTRILRREKMLALMRQSRATAKTKKIESQGAPSDVAEKLIQEEMDNAAIENDAENVRKFYL
ncbi:MAG: TIR domain-containing protein [candidate division Zixibacteria bacterium]|nr:TIR domain-containing protein [candidate division Zixibacteria bacterium]